ncbi:MAG: CHRD domain-containing protein [Phycisphaerales bacterium]|nr:CHRD domain-containing protein [Phycisphaerales bacterium]
MKIALMAAVGVVGLAAASQGAVTTYFANLSGPAESPVNNSPGIGTARVDYDDVAHTMRVRVTFSGLTGNVTACHIHGATATAFAGTAGVATPTPTFPGFPSGVKAGSYDNTLNLTLAASWNAAYITANGGSPGSAEAAFVAALNANKTYLNIHSSTFGGGEIRGFLTVPSTGSLAVLGLGGLVAGRRRR